ncbi:MAG: hypothetical protein WCY62_02505 [Clostridia bacterium]
MSGNTKILTRNAILLAIMMILLYLRTVIPTYQLGFYILASLLPGIVMMENGIKQTLIFIFASFILSLILPVDKLSFLLFYSLFGIYSVVKFLIEKIRYRVLVLVVKLAYFSAVFFISMYFAATIADVLPKSLIQYDIWLVYGIAVVFYVIYDYMYTQFSLFYMRKIKKHIS